MKASIPKTYPARTIVAIETGKEWYEKNSGTISTSNPIIQEKVQPIPKIEYTFNGVVPISDGHSRE